jgi:hypothetical protein
MKAKSQPGTQREKSQEKRKESRKGGMDPIPTTTKKLGLLFVNVPLL